MYKVKQIITDFFQENIWIIINEESGKSLIIDPGEISLNKFIEFFKSENTKPIAILNTHIHPDHIASAAKLQNKYQIPIFLHEKEKVFVKDLHQVGTMLGFSDFQIPEKIDFIKEGKFEFDEFKFEIILTSGHTPGSICIKFENCLISGDTLFKQSVGRVDLPGGSMDEMNRSIRILKNMDKDLIVYPGHGEKTTIGDEIKNNPYF